MPIELGTVYEPELNPPRYTAALADAFLRTINVTYHHIPAVNYFIIGVFTFFLAKLTARYNQLYTTSSLVATIATNLVLYGIADTLAQSILAHRKGLRQARLHNVGLFGARALSDSSVNTGYLTDDEEEVDTLMAYLDGRVATPPPVTPEPAPYPCFQFHRLAGFMAWGFMMAFIQVFWYSFLLIYSSDPTIIATIRKVLTDQLCFSPVSLFCFFNYTTRVVGGGSWEDTKAVLMRIYLPTLVANWSVWIPVQTINFLLIPRSMQVPFSSTVGVFWNCFLSMRSSEE